MKHYIRFYQLLRLTTPTRIGVLYVLVFTILNIVVYDRFMSTVDVFTVGFAGLFLWTLFVSIYYTYLTHATPTHPIYQFPITAKERVRNHYITPIVLFVLLSMWLVLFGILMVGLVSLFADVEGDTVTDPFYLAGTIYTFGHLLLVYAIFMPTSFQLDKKQRFITGGVGILFLVLVNYGVVFALTGSFSLSSGIPVVMEDSSMGLVLAGIVLVAGLVAVFGSYRISQQLVRYE